MSNDAIGDMFGGGGGGATVSAICFGTLVWRSASVTVRVTGTGPAVAKTRVTESPVKSVVASLKCHVAVRGRAPTAASAVDVEGNVTAWRPCRAGGGELNPAAGRGAAGGRGGGEPDRRGRERGGRSGGEREDAQRGGKGRDERRQRIQLETDGHI